MEDTYVYISVKLYLSGDQTEDSIQEIIQDLDYSFSHENITEHEIVDIIDTQICNEVNSEQQTLPFEHVDPYEILDDYNQLKNND